MRPTVRPVTTTELPAAAELAARLQRDPASHIGYLDVEAAALEQQLAELEPLGHEGLLGAFAGSALVGLLGTDWETDPPRVWWHGPLIDVADQPDGDAADQRWAQVAGTLYTAARRLLPDAIAEEEILPDERNERLARFAHHYGFALGAASAALGRGLASPLRSPGVPGVEVRRFHDEDRTTIATLHDRLFTGSHLPGRRIGDGRDRRVFVAVRDRVPIGYVAIDRQHAGQGYLDFLGVAAAERGLGIGRQLVAEACAWAREAGSEQVHLTVQTSNVAARRLYERLGFVEERILVPWRRHLG